MVVRVVGALGYVGLPETPVPASPSPSVEEHTVEVLASSSVYREELQGSSQLLQSQSLLGIGAGAGQLLVPWAPASANRSLSGQQGSSAVLLA